MLSHFAELSSSLTSCFSHLSFIIFRLFFLPRVKFIKFSSKQWGRRASVWPEICQFKSPDRLWKSEEGKWMSNTPQTTTPKMPLSYNAIVWNFYEKNAAVLSLWKTNENITPLTSDLHSTQGGHLPPGGPGGCRGGGRPAEQHARVRDHPVDLHGHGGVCRRQVRQQAGTGVSGLRHSLHPRRLRWGHQDSARSSRIPVSSDNRI